MKISSYHYTMCKIPFRRSIEILLIVVFALLIMFLFHYSRTDLFVSGLFYSPQTLWPFRDHFIFENLLHKGGVWVTVIVFLWIIYKLVRAYKQKRNVHLSLLMLVSSSLTVALVAFLKKYSTFPCPWHTDVFGGEQKIVGFLKLFSSELPNGHCFPAGHSSGGFCFLSFYVVSFLLTGKRNFKQLTIGLSLGIIFGLTQQVRGAHFLSHDMATIAISIFIPWLTTLIYCRYNNPYENSTHPN